MELEEYQLESLDPQFQKLTDDDKMNILEIFNQHQPRLEESEHEQLFSAIEKACDRYVIDVWRYDHDGGKGMAPTHDGKVFTNKLIGGFFGRFCR